MQIRTISQGLSLVAIATGISSAAISISVDATVASKPISPYIYGKNGGVSKTTDKATPGDTIQRYMDAGIKMLRLNNGNNATKYNWEKHLSSHPDWYNNVYANDNDWDYGATELVNKLPGVQGLFAISMLGWVANNSDHNFNDWLYNGGQWWTETDNSAGSNHNWAGTPAISAAGEKPTTNGDPTLYLEKWTSDKSVGILDHFFGSAQGQLGMNPNQFLYWNMDNEPDIWHGTHDDVMPDTMSAEEFIQIYVDHALKARAKYPNIKLVGPVTTNEWQWYYWHNKLITSGNTEYTFMEYFIKRIAEEQTRTGKKLLDVVDYHFYPDYKSTSDKAKIMQLHRMFFDKTYAFPKANAVKMAFSGTSNEYIFQRTRDWLTQYMGANHGVTLGMTEFGAVDGANADASVIAAMYASMLGEFASQGDVEIFTPWTQYQGMFETLHLFTQYAKAQGLPSQNSTDNLISVYPSISADKDSMTLIIVNRDQSADQQVQVSLNGFSHGGTWAPTFDLAYLQNETFKSSTVNGIYKNGIDIANGTFTISVPKVSVTAVVLSTTAPGTKPSFTERVIPSSSSSNTSSSSGASTVIWNPSMGLQVTPPSGTLSGWWYDYADPNSTVNALVAADVTANQGLKITYTAGTPTTENQWLYTGLGFNWNNTAKGANIVTSDLSAYSQFCVTYKSTVDLACSMMQTDPADPKKKVNFTAQTAFLASSAKTTVCHPWTDFGAGTNLNLAKQVGFQLETQETADFTVYEVSLVKSSSAIKPAMATEGSFKVYVKDGSLLLTLHKASAAKASLVNLNGQLVQTWQLQENRIAHTLDLAPIQSGRYILNVPGVGSRNIIIQTR